MIENIASPPKDTHKKKLEIYLGKSRGAHAIAV